ncbi:MAG: sulfotransferase family protein [Granulosicoccus sp.]|nr:sulfotransferase family protein [Granulosicoccus sp.]
MQKSPIFISGIGRSGTSAVISALAEHKQVIKPDRVGEGPFVQAFLNFLCDYEGVSADRDYHLKNYQLEEPQRAQLFATLMSQLQYGKDVAQAPDSEKYWIVKVSLKSDTFAKAQEIFGDVKVVYVIRNGIEVVNSARHFKGFANLNFEQLCRRWTASQVSLGYLMNQRCCALIRHEDLVSDPYTVFESAFKKLDLQQDSAPAEFIDSTLFNSSFNKSSKGGEVSKVFSNRLACWDEWSKAEQQTFIDICDASMQELDFYRPYEVNEPSVTAIKQPEVKQPEVKQTAVKLSPSGTESSIVGVLADGAMAVNMFDYHCNVSVDHKYLHMENPKVASTSILKVLQQQEDSQLAERMDNPHQRNQSPILRFSKLDESIQRNALTSSEYYRFAFVRNPFGRLLSAYLSKIARPLAPKAEILAIINGCKVNQVKDLKQPVDFASFIEVVCSQDPLDMNPHWNLQTLQLIVEKIDYHKIGRFENLQQDFAQVCTHIFGDRDLKITQSANQTSSEEKLTDYYDDALVKKVHQKFYDDFHAFEYSGTLHTLAQTA